MPPNLVLDTPATRSAETQPAISSVNSDIRSKGRWTRMIHHLNIGGERATDAASAPSNRETNTVSLQATVLNSARSPVPLDSTSSNRRGIRWHNVLASPSPVEGGELPNQMDGACI
ncbi:hypothetical protein FRC12_003485 [Ceratobasidium sp. 428]|nr:hypothetical protein FRC12_003485 [Ceratobasidium sp. 428]